MSKIDKFNNIRRLDIKEKIEEYNNQEIYLYEKNGEPKYARFICPCGCNEVLTLPIKEKGFNYHYPTWGIFIDDKNQITISPSINVNGNGGCNAHFFVRENAIEWV